MLLSPGWRRLGGLAGLVTLAVALAGCAGRTGRPLQSSGSIECERFLVAAQTALAATDSVGAPPGHAHAAAMHEYHACLAAHDSSDVAGPSSTSH